MAHYRKFPFASLILATIFLLLLHHIGSAQMQITQPPLRPVQGSIPPIDIYNDAALFFSGFQEIQRVEKICFTSPGATTVACGNTITGGSVTNLQVVSDPAPCYCTTRRVHKGYIYAYLHAGGDKGTYEQGKRSSLVSPLETWSATVTVKLEPKTFSGTSVEIGGVPVVLIQTLTIDQSHPEQLFAKDLTELFPLYTCPVQATEKIDHVTVTILNSPSVQLPGGTSYTDAVKQVIRLEAGFKEEYAVDVLQGGAGTSWLVQPLCTGVCDETANPVTFAWNTASCEGAEYPNYEFQLLRLYNTDKEYADDEERTKCTIDWSRALTIETGSKKRELTLTLAEGKGYYVWRVRPIGNYHDGGITNPRNWGVWSTAPTDGEVLTIENKTNSPISFPEDYQSCIFFYNQFDNNRNWSYSRVFTESNENGPRIGEQIQYADGLMNPVQSQTKMQSKDSILIGQAVYDYSGRASLVSMSVPVDQNKLQYIPNLMSPNSSASSPYTAQNFDDNSNYTSPEKLHSTSTINQYYSQNNPLLTVPDAQDYPFSRTLFYPDGRVREVGGVGETFRLKSTGARTKKIYYSSVTTQELTSIFGDEAPAANSCSKVITVDENNVAYVEYISKEGKLLATCLADNGELDGESTSVITAAGSGDLLNLEGDTINRLDITEKITDGNALDVNTFRSYKELTFLKQTSITLRYLLTPRDFSAWCLDYCKNCDYQITIRIVNKATQEVVYSTEPYIINPTSCGQSEKQVLAPTQITLQAGTYAIERIIETNTMDETATPPQAILETQIDNALSSATPPIQTLAEVMEALELDYSTTTDPEANAIAALSAYKAIRTTNNGQYNIRGTGDCSTISLPDASCPEWSCPSTTASPTVLPQFEKYLYDELGISQADRATIPLNRFFRKIEDGTEKFPTSYPSYTGFAGTSSEYPTGQRMFDELILNMLKAGYDCGELWKAWHQVVGLYKTLPFQDGNPNNPRIVKSTPSDYTFDLLEAFLDVTGRQITGVSTDPYNRTNGYLLHAYKSFNYTINSSGRCEQQFGYGTLAWTGSADNWKNLYNCVRMGKTPRFDPPDPDGIFPKTRCTAPTEPYSSSNEAAWREYFQCVQQWADGIEKDCRTECENMRPIFQDELRRQYAKLSQTVTEEALQCQVEAMMENCRQGCDLTRTWVGSANPQKPFTIGTTDETKAIAARKLGRFRVDLDGECASPYEQENIVRSYMELLVAYLNQRYDYYSKTSAQGRSGDILLTEARAFIALSDFPSEVLPGILDCIDAASAKFSAIWIYPNSKSHFSYTTEITDDEENPGCCTLLFHGQRSRIVAVNWVEKLNQYVDNAWAKPVPYFTPNDLTIATTEFHQSSTNTYYAAAPAPVLSPDPKAILNQEFAQSMRAPFQGTMMDGMPIFTLPDADISPDSVLSGVVFGTDGNLFALYGSTVAVSDTGVWRSMSLNLQFPRQELGEPIQKIEVRLVPELAENGDLLLTRLEHRYGDKVEVKLFATSPSIQEIECFTENSFTSNVGEFIEIDGYIAYKNLSNLDVVKLWPIDPYEQYTETMFTCEGLCINNSCGICIEWHTEMEPFSSDGAVVFRPRVCAEKELERIKTSIADQYIKVINGLREQLRQDYRKNCSTADNLQETFQVDYHQKYYHYTLFYYDRVGNLVRTVQPKGVADLATAASRTRADHPEYRFKTEYRYNATGGLIQKLSPDEETDVAITSRKGTWYGYNVRGQLRFSQNAAQRAASKYSYMVYDNLGRVIESGQASGTFTDEAAITTAANSTTHTISARAEVTRIRYSTTQTLPAPYAGLEQENLQNRVSISAYDLDGTEGNSDDVRSYYSYDVHGNVAWVVQQVPGLGASKVEYEYDLVSGNVRQLWYRKGYADQFSQRFDYDADNRLQSVESSRDGMLWDKDAGYDYYTNGALRRVAIGEDSVQGVDYVYTLQGWLKGVNHPSRESAKDPGKDGNSVGTGKTKFAQDAFGMALGYYTGDFQRSYGGVSSTFNSQSGNDHNLNATNGLYNGTITSWTSSTQPTGVSGKPYEGLTGNTYRYDRLGRLRSDVFVLYGGSPPNFWGSAGPYNSSYTYDENGNLKTLNRKAAASSGAFGDMDQLTYSYGSTISSNRLTGVTDPVSSSTFSEDIDGTTSYTYDKIGRITGDGSRSMTWNSYNKVVEISGTPTVKYTYGSAGERVKKEVYYGVSDSRNRIEWYMYDAGGQLLSVYELASGGDIVQKEIPLYGQGRLGMATSATVRSTSSASDLVADASGLYTRIVDMKLYELLDHLGNVRAVVGDVKLVDGSGGYKADLKSYSNYYPFGMLQPNRSWQLGEAYSFGYNGVLMDDEVYGKGNLMATEFRMFDTRLGRWWGRDPIVKVWESPYAGMFNDPINYMDPSGLNGTGVDHTPRDNGSSEGIGGGAESTDWRSLGLSAPPVEGTNYYNYGAKNQAYNGLSTWHNGHLISANQYRQKVETIVQNHFNPSFDISSTGIDINAPLSEDFWRLYAQLSSYYWSSYGWVGPDGSINPFNREYVTDNSGDAALLFYPIMRISGSLARMIGSRAFAAIGARWAIIQAVRGGRIVAHELAESATVESSTVFDLVPKAFRKDVIDAFVGKAEKVVLTEDIIVYRHWGGVSNEVGYWVSPYKYAPEEARSILALPNNNPATTISAFRIKAGTTIIRGRVASQAHAIWAGPYATGGGIQIYVPNLQSLISFP